MNEYILFAIILIQVPFAIRAIVWALDIDPVKMGAGTTAFVLTASLIPVIGWSIVLYALMDKAFDSFMRKRMEQ